MLRRMHTERQHQVFFGKCLHRHAADAHRDRPLEHPLHVEVHGVKLRQNVPLQLQQIAPVTTVKGIFVSRVKVRLGFVVD